MARRATRRASASDLRTRRANIAATIKLIVVGIVILAVGATYFLVYSSRKSLDQATLCPADPVSITVLLVDVTDPMNIPQKQDFLNQLTKLKNEIPRYGKLIVAKVDATKTGLLRPVIVRCNPGVGSDVTEATGNPAELQRQWAEGFDKPLNAAFEQLTTASGADQSPILESIQSIALTELQKPEIESKPRKLVVASDLLQNTDDISFYRGLPDPKEFVRSTPFRRVRTDLRGVDVELWMLERSDAAATQPRALAELWESIMLAEGANVLRIYNVNG